MHRLERLMPRNPKARLVVSFSVKIAVFVGAAFAMRALWPAVGVTDKAYGALVGKMVDDTVLFLLLLAMFWRDIRLLGRFLGAPTGIFRSSAAVLVALLLMISATVAIMMVLPREAGAGNPRLQRFIRKNVMEPIAQTGKVGAAPVMAGAAICITIPLVEELLLRGALFLLLLRIVGKWPAVLVSSVIFAALHQIGMSAISWPVFCVHTTHGLMLCLVLLYTHRLRWCVVLHSLWNSSMFAVTVFVSKFLHHIWRYHNL